MTKSNNEWVPEVDSIIEVRGSIYGDSDNLQWMESKVYAIVDGKVLARSTTHADVFVLYLPHECRPIKTEAEKLRQQSTNRSDGDE